MTSCPPVELLQRMLAGHLSDVEEAAAGSHLEACAQCQQVLEALTAFEAPGAAAPGSVDRAGGEALGEGELQRLWTLLSPARPPRCRGPAPASSDSPAVLMSISRTVPRCRTV